MHSSQQINARSANDRRVPDLIARSVLRLRDRGVEPDQGLSDEEVSRAEIRSATHSGPSNASTSISGTCRRVLAGMAQVPGGGLQGRLDWAVEGVLFDLDHNGFWPTTRG